MQSSYAVQTAAQAPGKYLAAALKGQRIDDQEMPSGYACGIPLVSFAYIICLYLVVEGAVLLLSGLLRPVAWGDIMFACIGAFGLLCSQSILPLGPRLLAKWQDTVAMLGVGSLVAWRTVVCLGFAPWAGITLASASPSIDKFWLLIAFSIYLGFSIFLAYVLVMAFRQVMYDSKRLQQDFDDQAIYERRRLLMSVHDHRRLMGGQAVVDHEDEQVLFAVLPLAETVTVYAMIIAIASLWEFVHVCLTGQTSGGWAFFEETPVAKSTFWLEVFLWPVTFVCALIGIFGVLSLRDVKDDDSRPNSSPIYVFVVGNALRFGLLFAVTGMDLIQRNMCGFYLNGLVKVAASSYWSAANGMIHCSGMEYLSLAGIIFCFLLDLYMLCGSFQLWCAIRDLETEGLPAKAGFAYASLEDKSPDL